MKLSAYFPVSCAPGTNSFYDAPTKNWKRLSIACKHTVTGRVAGVDRAGSADIQYNLDFRPEVNLSDVVNLDSSVLLALQTRDVVKSHVEKLRPRLPYDISSTTPGFADFRALMAVVSAAQAAGAARVPVVYGRSIAEYQTTPAGYREPRIGDMHIGPSLCKTSAEFITFLKLAGEAGVKRVTLLSDTTPTPEAVALSGRALSVFCAKIKTHLQATANELCVYGAHELASVAGTTAAISLNGHSDEGGWCRSMLKSASFPPSTGILLGTGTEFNGMPLQECIHKDDILTKVVADYLSTIALAHVADVTLNGSTSIYERAADDEPCIDSYGFFAHDIDRVLQQWVLLISERDGMHPDAQTDGSAYSRQFNKRAHDRHLEKCEVIAPWWWVETSPLVLDKHEGYEVCARHSEVVDLPLVASTSVTHDSPVLDDRGRIMHGASCAFTRESKPFRMEGASYLFNPRYVDGETLARFQVNDRGVREASDAFMFAGGGNPDFETMRWRTPHNPLPHPLEGLSDGPVEVQARTVDYMRDPTPEDLAGGRVKSVLGMFFIKDKSDAGARTTFRSCPRRLRRAMKLDSPHFQRLFRIDVKPSPPVAGITSAPVVTTGTLLSDVESGDEDSDLSSVGEAGTEKPAATEPAMTPADSAGEPDAIDEPPLDSAPTGPDKAQPGDPLNRPTQPKTDKADDATKRDNEGESAAPV